MAGLATVGGRDCAPPSCQFGVGTSLTLLSADAYGQRVNKKLIRAIMAEQALSGLPRRRKGKPNLVHRATSADLVNRVFHRDGPRLNHFGHACS